MSSTYSTILKFSLIDVGSEDGTWGTVTNTNLGTLIEHAIAGRSAVTHDDAAAYTLTTNNGAADEARRAILNIGGALTAARNTVCPTQSKLYVVKNATTGGFATTLKTSAGTGISIPNGKTTFLMCDGTNVVDAIDYLSTLTVGNGLTVTAGGLTVTAGDVAVNSGTLTISGFVSSSSSVRAWTGTAPPAGGTVNTGILISNVSSFGIFFGTGAPTLNAAKGSLYLRRDGSGTGDRAYINTDGGGTWTATTTAA